MDDHTVDVRHGSVGRHQDALFIQLEPQRILLKRCLWFGDARHENFRRLVVHAAFRGKWQSGRLHAKESGGGPRGSESVRRGRDLPNRVGELNGADSGTGPEGGLHASQSDGQREFEVTASRNLEPLWKSIDFDETVFPPTMPTGQTWESIFADRGPAAQGDPSIERFQSDLRHLISIGWCKQFGQQRGAIHPRRADATARVPDCIRQCAAQTGRDSRIFSGHQSEGRSPTCRQRLGGLLGFRCPVRGQFGGGVGLVSHQRQTPPRQGILRIRSTRAGGQVQRGTRNIGGRHPAPACWLREARGSIMVSSTCNVPDSGTVSKSSLGSRTSSSGDVGRTRVG